jgi:DNA repair protein RecO (recombination protein O)
MGIEKIEAIVMRSYPLGDTSRIVQLLSPERGRIAVVAKGVRGPKSRFGAALEPFTTIGAVIYYKADRDLQFLSQAEIRARHAILASSILRFAYASAVVELLDQAIAGEEPPGPLYGLVQTTLAELEHVPEDALRGAFMGYVARLMSVLGYRPEVMHCVACSGDAGEGAAWNAVRGGVVCARCAPNDATAIPFSAAARASLSAFLAGGAAPVLERPLGDELARTLDTFMRMHLPRYRGLRSLKVVREVSANE